MLYYVYENKAVGTPGNMEFIETLLFSGSREECAAFEDKQRKTYSDRTRVDCYTISDEDLQKRKAASELWDSLTDEQKKETIVVNGKTYVKAVYEATHGKAAE